MILELREIYRQSVTTTFSFDESGDSLDADNTEEIKVRERGQARGGRGKWQRTKFINLLKKF